MLNCGVEGWSGLLVEPCGSMAGGLRWGRGVVEEGEDEEGGEASEAGV